jgi:hypothetical protein
MAEEGSYPPRMYWRLAWRQRSKAKLFSLARVLPSLGIAVVQFFWLRNNRPTVELWIIVGTIVTVYLVFWFLNILWNAVGLAPVKLYAEQIEVMSELRAKNSFLERELREPQVSPQDQRRRLMVSEKMKTFDEIGRKILRFIDDQGEVNALALQAEHNFAEAALRNFIAEAVPSGLILYQNHIVRIKPELKSAVEFVFANEYDRDLKD